MSALSSWSSTMSTHLRTVPPGGEARRTRGRPHPKSELQRVDSVSTNCKIPAAGGNRHSVILDLRDRVAARTWSAVQARAKHHADVKCLPDLMLMSGPAG